MPEKNNTSDNLASLAVELSQSVSGFLKSVVPHPERFLGPSAVPLLTSNETSTTTEKKGKKRKSKKSTANNNEYTLPNECLQVTSTLFNHACQLDPEPELFGPITSLTTDGLDHEQIWQCMQLRNEPLLDWAQNRLQSLKDALDSLDAGVEEEEEEENEEELNEYSDEQDESEEDEEEEEDDDELIDTKDTMSDEEDLISDSEMMEGRSRKVKKSLNLARFTGDSDDDDESDHDDEFAAAEGLDDEFFSLKEMNKFADDAEDAEWRDIEREERGDISNEDDEQDEESDIDLFQDPDAMGESDEEDEEDELDASEIKYADFFLPPKKHNKGDDDDKKKKMMMKKKESTTRRVEFMDEDEEESDGDDDDNEEEKEESEMDDELQVNSKRNLFADDDEDDSNGKDKSRFEQQQEKMQKKIQELEEESIAKKDWALLGEATGKTRPVNSLLEEDLEFEHASKPVPVITEEVTATIEDMIKQRIINNQFDDVVRKKDPKVTPFKPSEQFEFNDERSKQSLAQIYEDEYVKATSEEPVVHAKDEALQKEHDEIDGLWRHICSQLDALSNQHFVPKQPKTEIKVVADVAAISMEEATPVTANTASLLAPEEVYEKKRGEVKGVTELDQAERRRLRNRKKRLHKLRHGTTGDATATTNNITTGQQGSKKT